MPKTNSEFERETIEFLVQTEARRLRRLRRVLNLRWLWIALVLWVGIGLREAVAPVPGADYYVGDDGTPSGEHLLPLVARRGIPERIPWVGLGFVTLTGWPLFALLRRAREGGAASAIIITDIKSPAAVGPLSAWLGSRDRIARGLAESRLLELLPRMKPGDSPLLSDADHARLNRVFTSHNSELALAVLAAWEQVGDERDVLAVQYVSEGLDIGRADARVREAAVSCLPFLTERAEKRKRAATLLRPSGGTSSDRLLRPASDASSKKVQALLRPHGDRQPDGT